jgi:hypothetical protein
MNVRVGKVIRENIMRVGMHYEDVGGREILGKT